MTLVLLQLYLKLMNSVLSERTKLQSALREHETGMLQARHVSAFL